MVAYPGGLDTFVNPLPSDDTDSPDHALQHGGANDAVEALEVKVGITNSADVNSLDYKVRNNLGMPLGLTGATAATRYVGGTTTGTPVSGTFNKGDVVIAQTGHVYICTVAGSPGTWTEAGSSSSVGSSFSLPDFIIYRSGVTFFARNTTTGNDDFSGTDAGAVVQAAHDTFTGGGLIELKRNAVYLATTQVTISIQGVCIRSTPQVGEAQPTNWQVNSQLPAGQAAFRMTSSGASLGGLSVECNSFSDYGIDMRGPGQQVFDCNLKEADIANFYANGPAGAARCTFWNIRSDNGTANGSINIKLDGPDHVAWGLRTGGTATNGYSLWMDTSRCQIASGHITGAGPEAACVFISGSENRLSDFYMDTGPDGSNGRAHTIIQGSGNYFSALVQNASTDAQSAATKAVNAVAFVTLTTYRFTTTTAHGYSPNQGVMLQDFASSTGFFSGGVTSGAFVITATTTNTFDVDLGVVTAFTDSVGTASPITVVTGTAFVSGNTYRFTTSAAHGYSQGDAIWLQGFSSSNGFFNGTTSGNVLISTVPPDPTHFDADLGATTTFTDSTGTAKRITKFGLLLQLPPAAQSKPEFVQGNVIDINFQGKGAHLNDGEFYYAVGFMDENGNDPTTLTRFSGNRITANAANSTRFSNLESNWGNLTNVDKISVDVWTYQQNTTTPMKWRTRANGITSALTASSWTINHGLAGLPGDVQITPRADPGTATWYVSSVTATQIVITSSGPITNARWAWKVAM